MNLKFFLPVNKIMIILENQIIKFIISIFNNRIWHLKINQLLNYLQTIKVNQHLK